MWVRRASAKAVRSHSKGPEKVTVPRLRWERSGWVARLRSRRNAKRPMKTATRRGPKHRFMRLV